MATNLNNPIIAEKAVLKSVLLNFELLQNVVDIINDAVMFNSEIHQLIYKSMLNMYSKQIPIDIVTTMKSIKSLDKHKIIKDQYLIDLLIDNAVPTMNIKEYALIVKQHYIQRCAKSEAEKLIKEIDSGDIEQLEAPAIAENRFRELGKLIENKHEKTPKSLASEVYDIVEKSMKGESEGFKTGLYEYDERIGDMHPGDYIIIAGRTSTGKTSLAITMAYNMQFHYGIPVCFITCEMTDVKIVYKLISMGAHIPYEILRKNKVDNNYMTKITAFLSKFSQSGLYVEKNPNPNSIGVRTLVRRMVDKYGVKVVFFDYLQLVQGANKKNDTREREIAEFSATLRSIALEHNVAMVALAQLNRQTEISKEKIPQLKDLRESGSIENDADIVSMIYRPEIYNIKTIDISPGNTIDSANKAVILNLKGRETGINKCTLGFDPKYSHFYNLDFVHKKENNEDVGF